MLHEIVDDLTAGAFVEIHQGVPAEDHVEGAGNIERPLDEIEPLEVDQNPDLWSNSDEAFVFIQTTEQTTLVVLLGNLIEFLGFRMSLFSRSPGPTHRCPWQTLARASWTAALW